MPRMTIDDFLTGLLAALAVRGYKTISIRGERFDAAMQHVYGTLMDVRSDFSLDVRFRIQIHPVHRDSPAVRDAVSTAAQRDLISLDNPEYQDIRLKINPAAARAILETVPGGAPLYDRLASDFLEHYELVAA